MAEPESKEYQTIIKSMIKLSQYFRRDLRSFALFFIQNDFISQSDYDEVLNPKSFLTNDQKAEKLLLGLRNEVEMESAKYHQFTNQLRKNPKYGNIVELLDKTFQSLGGNAAAGSNVAQGGPQEPQTEADQELGIDDHLEVVNAVRAISAKWDQVAEQLGLTGNTISNIREDGNSGSVRLSRAIDEWLHLNYDSKRHGRPTWRLLAKIIGRIDNRLSESIKRDHGIPL